ncbi:MAG: HAMP domain-containing histidine kinase [Gemmatimonadetes bacterium]|nr:HAMP domain-containing histidine kinase [Gemmatimonadota bacterium]
MTYSLRRTLAVRFSLTIFAALLLIALWAFLGAQRTLRTALDNGLVSALNLERDVLASGSTLPAHAGPTEFGEFVHNVNRFVVVRDARGNILNMNTALAGDLPIDSAGFALARHGGISWVTTPWGDERVRSVYAPVPTNSPAGMSVVQVAASLHPLAEENREVLFLLLGTVLLGTVATAFGAVWLAGSAVQPVGEITAQAEAIEAGVSGQRITAHADVAEFHGLVSVLNSVLERLDRAFQAQRRIIADVAHDLRTPITAVRGEIEIALRGQRTPEQYRATLASILEGVDHLSGINEALILLARIEAGELVPQLEPVDLATLAASAVQRVHPRAGGRALRFQGPWAGSVTALADPGMIGVLLDQLLDNAVRHTPPDTRVEAIVRANGGKVSVAVRDNGPGIAEEVLPHLFERFYRADPARSRTAGPGLGLTVAAAIAQAHRGSIRAANLPTGGLEVTVALPSDHAEG